MRGGILGLCLVLALTGTARAQELIQTVDAGPAESGERLWTRVDYLLWWAKPVCLKLPIVTTNATGPGILTDPGTTVVLGGSKFEFPGASGVRPGFGYWFSPDHVLGFEASGFVMETRANDQRVALGSADAPGFLPFQNPDNTQAALPFTIPGVVDGYSLAVGRSRLWGTEANLVTEFNAQRGSATLTATYLFGFRQLDLQESVDISNIQRLVADPAVFAVGQNLFSTRNSFFGAQIGGRVGIQWNNFEVEAGLKVALGETYLSVSIAGNALTAGAPVLPGLLPGPIFVTPSNAGRETSWRISVVPEADVRFSYRLGDAWRLSLGYHVIYLNRNVCPGDEMSSIVNTNLLPGGNGTGPRQPKNPFAITDYYAGGLVAGVEWRY